MNTRSKIKTLVALANLVVIPTDLDQTEPSDIHTAMQYAFWSSAVQDERNALSIDNTWNVMSLPSGRIPMVSRWLFKIK